MTSNTTPYGQVIYSSYLDSEYPYRAFNGNWSTTNGNSWASVNVPHWIGYKFVNKVCVISVTIKNTGYGSQQPTSFIVEASNDGNTWLNISGVIQANTTTTATNTYDINNNDEYLYYRIVCTNTQGGCVSIQEIQFNGYF